MPITEGLLQLSVPHKFTFLAFPPQILPHNHLSKISSKDTSEDIPRKGPLLLHSVSAPPL